MTTESDWVLEENTDDEDLTCRECGDPIPIGDYYYEDQFFNVTCSACQ